MKPSSGHWNGPSDEPPASPSASLKRLSTSGRENASSAESIPISVIIPTLNEATTIEACLGQFGRGSGISTGPGGLSASGGSGGPDGPDGSIEPGSQGDPGGPGGPDEPVDTDSPGETASPEIIVVDGGSDDGTAGIVRSCPGIRLIETGTRGRAVQMNAGAAASSGDVLLFLHADTRLPERWREYVTDSILRGGMAGGRFRFDVAHPSRVYRWIARGTNLRSRFLGITYGDQAIYAARTKFEQVGGYPEIPVFEDAGLADRLKQAGGLDWVDEPVLTSARRWERRGPLRTLLLTWTLRALYTLSVSPNFLTRFYGVVR